jgi:hypothetical protein
MISMSLFWRLLMKLLVWNKGRGWDSQYNTYSSARGMISSQGGRITDVLGPGVFIPEGSCAALAAGGSPLELTLIEVSEPHRIVNRDESFIP